MVNIVSNTQVNGGKYNKQERWKKNAKDSPNSDVLPKCTNLDSLATTYISNMFNSVGGNMNPALECIELKVSDIQNSSLGSGVG